MSKPEQATDLTLRQQKILDQLKGGIHTWEQLRVQTKINDENLGFTIGEILNLRKIWTAQRSEVRVYGIGRRSSLLPRFAPKRRRSGDQSN